MRQVASRLGVTNKSIYDWTNRYSDDQAPHHQITDQQKEIRRLKAELKRAEEERDILKKAAAYFVPLLR